MATRNNEDKSHKNNVESNKPERKGYIYLMNTVKKSAVILMVDGSSVGLVTERNTGLLGFW